MSSPGRRVSFSGQNTGYPSQLPKSYLSALREHARGVTSRRKGYVNRIRAGNFPENYSRPPSKEDYEEHQEELIKIRNRWYLCNAVTAVCTLLGAGALAYYGLRGGGTRKRRKSRKA